jgi:hypothetical protein
MGEGFEVSAAENGAAMREVLESRASISCCSM